MRGCALRLCLALAVAPLAGCYISVGNGVVVGALKITQAPQSVTVRAGASAEFSVSVLVIGGTPSFQWRRNGAAIAGAGGSTYITPPLSTADSGSLFDVQVCDQVECVISDAATVTVLP